MSADVIAANFAKLSRLPLARVLDGTHAESMDLLEGIESLALELQAECRLILDLDGVEAGHRDLAQAGLQSAEQILAALAKSPLRKNLRAS
ncbi:hypothetical protein ACLBXM_11215 [Xanthobacteraceae bacterium A53D]